MNTWQPIATAPKDGTRVLLFFPFKEKGRVRIGSWKEPGWLILEPGSRGRFPTHWAPIPKGPE